MALEQKARLPCHPTGFTLTELLVSTVMLLIVLASVASMFESTNRQTLLTERRYKQEADIDADLALISKLIEHYTCTQGTTTLQCQSNINAHPTKNGYFPNPTATDLVNAFEAACNQVDGQTLLTPLIGTGGIIATTAPVSQDRLNGLSRTITRTNLPDGRGHRYTVTYFVGDANGEMMRQTSFVPTAANWCPDIP